MNHRHKKLYNQYISALKKLINAQNKAREFFPSVPLQPLKEPQEMPIKGRKVLQRLNKAYKEYAEKARAWRDYLKTYDL